MNGVYKYVHLGQTVQKWLWGVHFLTKFIGRSVYLLNTIFRFELCILILNVFTSHLSMFMCMENIHMWYLLNLDLFDVVMDVNVSNAQKMLMLFQ